MHLTTDVEGGCKPSDFPNKSASFSSLSAPSTETSISVPPTASACVALNTFTAAQKDAPFHTCGTSGANPEIFETKSASFCPPVPGISAPFSQQRLQDNYLHMYFQNADLGNSKLQPLQGTSQVGHHNISLK